METRYAFYNKVIIFTMFIVTISIKQYLFGYSIEDTQFNNKNVARWSREGEFLIDTAIFYVAIPYNQLYPSVAFDGVNYFIVWSDYRNGFSYNIYGARVSAEGVIIDTAGIPIAMDAHTLYSPVVAFGATNYLVVWGEANVLYGARMNTAGTLLDTQAIVIPMPSDPYWWNYDPSITFDGTNYMLVWDSDYCDYYFWMEYIFGLRISQDGTIIDPSPIAINHSYSYGLHDPSIAFDGTNYMVAWLDDRNIPYHHDIYGTRITQNGVIIDTSNIAISIDSSGQGSPAVAFDSTNYLVVWDDDRNGAVDIYGARVSPNGRVLDSSGIAISTASDEQQNPSVTFGDTNYMILWQDLRNGQNYDIYASRIDPQGLIIDSAGIVVSAALNDQESPAIAFNGENYFAVWEDDRDSLHSAIYGSRIDPSGVILDSIGLRMTSGVNEQRFSAAAFDEQNYFIVWVDNRSDSAFDIYGARVDPSGAIQDTHCIPVSTADNDQSSPAIAFDGVNYLVVWEDKRSGCYDIYATRISAEGTVLDPNGFAISAAVDSQRTPSVAFDGTNYLVGWQDRRNGNYDVYCARVNTAGVVIDINGIRLPSTNSSDGFPAIAFDGINYFVVWSHGNNRIYGTRISPSGTILDTSGIVVMPAISLKNPAVCFDGCNFFVVGNDADIYGARVNQQGIVMDPSGIDITHVSGDQSYPSVAFDGTNYVVMWQDYRNGFWDIYGARVSTGGVLIDSIDAFPVVWQPGAQIAPALARGPGNTLLVTYSGFTDFVNSRPANTMRIWGKFYPFTGIEETASYPVSNASHTLKVFPNPFTAKTAITYSILDGGYRVKNSSLRIYDVVGKLVRSFNLESGLMNYESNIIWDGRDDAGRELPPGVYFVQLKTNDRSKTEKAILIR